MNEQKVFKQNFLISKREVSYANAESALISPIARKLFGFPWVENVTVGSDFVAVTKQDWVEWEVLEEPLRDLIQEHFLNYKNLPIEENPMPQQINTNELGQSSAEFLILQKTIETKINPMLANHGGYATLKDFKNETAYIEMGGGCQGCGASYVTLKDGIEKALKEVMPNLREVVDVTNHAGGINPYM